MNDNGIIAATIGAVGSVVAGLLGLVLNIVLKNKAETHALRIDMAVVKDRLKDTIDVEKKVGEHTEKLIELKTRFDVEREQNNKDKRAFFDKIRAIESKH